MKRAMAALALCAALVLSGCWPGYGAAERTMNRACEEHGKVWNYRNDDVGNHTQLEWTCRDGTTGHKGWN